MHTASLPLKRFAWGCLSATLTHWANADVAALFADDTVLELQLEIPVRELKKIDRGEERAGVLRLADGAPLDVQVSTRGHARRETCKSMPPLWVNFKKKQLENTPFEGQDKLKLVTHCRDSDRFDDLVVSEYLNYKILNLMTDASYRVRLARITYFDAADDRNQGPRFGFFIEHKKQLSERLGLEPLEVEKIEPRQLNPVYAAPLEVFSFMVSHTDWSAIQGSPDDDCCHNAHLFTPPDWTGGDGEVVPVGYDFDLTGSVNPPYGQPPLELRSWRQRLYRGWCWDPALIDENVDKTLALRDEIEALIMTNAHLAERRRKDMWRFIEGYYKILDNPKRKQRMIGGACRELPSSS